MTKLLFTTSSFNLDHFKERSLIEAAGIELVFNPYGRRLTELEVSALLDEHVIGMVAGLEPLTAAVLGKARSLKVISRCGVGLDNVDMEAAKKNGIHVLNTPNAPTTAVAELTMAHILTLLRRVIECDRLLRAGTWKPMMGGLLDQKTVGVIGYGRIGRAVTKRLEAFGARVLVFEENRSNLPENVRNVSFEHLLCESDIITLHLPYNAKTHHIINEKTISSMKSTALLVNTSRGGLIDEEALLHALIEKRLSGVALDCFEVEPYFGPLLSFDRVQVTSHMGSYADETRAAMESEACSELVVALKKQGLLECL